MDRYCEHNRERDSYGNNDCPYCEVEFLHKVLADCDRKRKKWKDRIKELEAELTKARAENNNALDYAQKLAVIIWEKRWKKIHRNGKWKVI